MSRVDDAEEIAKAVLWLLLDRASFVGGDGVLYYYLWGHDERPDYGVKLEAIPD